MGQKRKACKSLDEHQGEEEGAGHWFTAGIPLHEEAFSTTMTSTQACDFQDMVEAAGPSKGTPEHPVGGASAVDNSDSDDSKGHSDRKPKPKKKTIVTEEARLKKIVLKCEWNKCTAEYKKMLSFTAHITEHLQIITEPVSKDGYICDWRECEFTCCKKDELDRHVYYHAFHTKIKSMGAVVMEERNEKCILDSSERNLIPELPENFECLWEDCRVQFLSAHDFYCHTVGHVNNAKESGKGVICAWEGCYTSFSKRVIRKHIMSHTKERRVSCPNCGTMFISNYGFLLHIIRQIPIESQQYQCSHCSRRYPSEPLLRYHLRIHINRFKCQECGLTVPTKASLKKHMLYRHKKDKSFKCLQCGKGFAVLNDVNRHMVTHSVEPAYTCSFNNCTYSARTLSSLNKHIKVVHEGFDKKHFACHLCDLRYSSGRRLSNHLKSVHGLKCPPGYCRFRYNMNQDGFYRLQTVCYEDVKVETVDEDEAAVDSPEASMCPSSPASVVT